jgi:hypothetical protein
MGVALTNARRPNVGGTVRHPIAAAAAVVRVLITGCTSSLVAIRGKAQDLVVRTSPEGAECSVLREGTS